MEAACLAMPAADGWRFFLATVASRLVPETAVSAREAAGTEPGTLWPKFNSRVSEKNKK